MKKIFAYVILSVAGVAAQAATFGDTEYIEFGVNYDIPSTYKPAEKPMKLTTASAGEVTFSYMNSWVNIYADEAMTQEVSAPFKGFGGVNGSIYAFTAEANHVYYVTHNGFGGRIQFDTDANFALAESQPAAGSYYSNNGDGVISLRFTNPVAEGATAYIYVGGESQGRIGAQSHGAYLNLSPGTVLSRLYTEQKLKRGDRFEVRISGIKTLGGTYLNGTGELTLEFIAAGDGIKLVRQQVPPVFKSYFVPGDPNGILSLTFSGDLMNDGKTVCTISHGVAEQVDTDFFIEHLPVTIDGATATVDFTGVSRRMSELNISEDAFPYMSIQVANLRDTNGDYVQTTDQGAVGSYNFSPMYEEVPVLFLTADFMPANGGSLEGRDNVLVWLSSQDQFTFTGFKFEYEGGSKVVAKADCAYAADNATEGEYTVAIPAEAKGKAVTVSLDGFVAYDGVDHTRDVRASYDQFVVTFCDPKDNSDLESLAEGQLIRINTNYTSKYPSMVVEFEVFDLAANSVKAPQKMTRAADNYYEATVSESLRLERGHTYSAVFTAYESEGGQSLGSYEVLWKGKSKPFEVSGNLFTGITPADGSSIETDGVTFTLSFDGLVSVEAAKVALVDAEGLSFESVTGEGEGTYVAEDNGKTYAPRWNLKLSAETLVKLPPTFSFTVQAYDQDDLLVMGEAAEGVTYNDSSKLTFTYSNAKSGIEDIVAGSPKGPMAVYNLLGVKVATVASEAELRSLPAGLYIVGGKKISIR